MISVNFCRSCILFLLPIALFGCSTFGMVQTTLVEKPKQHFYQVIETIDHKINQLQIPTLSYDTPISDEAEQAFQKALSALEARNYMQAEQAFSAMTKQFPKLSGPDVNLGIVYETTDRADLAATAWQSAIEKNDENIVAYNLLAISHRKQGRFDDARILYTTALEKNDAHADTHYNLGILYDLYLQNLPLALYHYQRYQALQPEPDPLISQWISDIKNRSGNILSENSQP